MQFKWIATAALGVALAPGVLLAQSKTSTDTSKTSSASQTTTTTASTGDVSSSSNVTPAMLKAQDDPNLIGSPAWWKTHSTADGKPLSAKSQTGTADTAKSRTGKP
jgi:hypothetical protein